MGKHRSNEWTTRRRLQWASIVVTVLWLLSWLLLLFKHSTAANVVLWVLVVVDVVLFVVYVIFERRMATAKFNSSIRKGSR